MGRIRYRLASILVSQQRLRFCMSVRPAGAPPLPTPSEMALLVAEAGLTLNAGQMADLALAWRQLVGLVARIPRDRPLLDDQAYVFRLSPPGAAVGAPSAGKRAPAKAPLPASGASKPRVATKSAKPPPARVVAAAKPKSGAAAKAKAPVQSAATAATRKTSRRA